MRINTPTVGIWTINFELMASAKMTHDNMLSIQVQKEDAAFRKLLSELSDTSQELETSSFDGQSEIVTVLLTLTPVLVGFLGKAISDQIKARRYVKVVYRGLQIQGLSDKNATRLIEKLIEKDDGKH